MLDYTAALVKLARKEKVAREAQMAYSIWYDGLSTDPRVWWETELWLEMWASEWILNRRWKEAFE